MEDDCSIEDITEKDVISFVNGLLQKCGIEFSVTDISECKSDLYLALYNAVLGDLPPGALIDCNSTDAQVHNVKCIIETLAVDYLKVDLSHISAQDVVEGELVSIYNLVEILDGMLDYLMEKMTSESDTGDDGDIDSDQLSDNARAIALETIQRVIATQNDMTSDTADLIALGTTFEKEPSNKDEFTPLKPHISLTPEPNDLPDLTDHTLLVTGNLSPTESIPRTDFSGIPSDPDSFKSLPKDLTGISSTLSRLKVDIDEVPTRLRLDETKITRPSSSSSSTIVVSDSGSSMDSERRRQALDVELDSDKGSFQLKGHERSRREQEWSGAESVDVPDGRTKPAEKLNTSRSADLHKERAPPTPKAKDWQAMLDNLQKTVEESRRIRDEYFSSFRSRTLEDESGNDNLEISAGNNTLTTEDTLDESASEHQERRKKNVRFEDTISTKTAKELTEFRQLLQQEKALQDEKNKILSRSFKDHLDEVRTAEDEKLSPLRRKVGKGGKQVKASLQKQKGKPKSGRRKNLTDSAKLQSWLSPSKTYPQRLRSTRPTTPKRVAGAPLTGGIDSINEHDLLPKLLEEFPQLELPPAVLNEMWQKQFRQIEHLTKATYDHRNQKQKSEMQLHQAHMKHELLTKIMQKEHDHTRRLRDIRERVSKQKEAQRMLRDRRLQAARVRKYYKDYHLQMRSKMMKRRTKEEKIFKRLFEDGLEIQRARLRELRKYAKEKREEQQKRQIDEIQSLENYYKDQFNILADTLAKEKSDLKVRDEAQVKLIRQMKKGLRQKMESEIQNLQDMITRDDEDAYFREIEADRLRRQLQLATYHAKFHD